MDSRLGFILWADTGWTMVEKKIGLTKAGLILLFAVALFFLPGRQAEATHLRAGEITVERVNCVSRTFRITVRVYTDTGSPVLFGGDQDVLDFGDGFRVLVPETGNIAFPGAPNVGTASYTIIHTYSGPDRYTISYLEPNRNEGVLNIDNSVGTTFYIETSIDLSVLGCDDSPRLLVPPIDVACSGVAFYHNPGAFDPDGDSLSFELVVPFRDRNTPVLNYRDPSSPEFYVDFNNGNETGDGPPTFVMDPIDGTLIWNAPGNSGEYNIAFVIREFRRINGVWVEIGFVRRDMQIIVEADCTNERPELIIPEDVCVVARETINETIFGTDPENHNVRIQAFSEIFALDSPAVVDPPFPGVFGPSNPPAELEFTWETACGHVKDQAYQVVFKITDDPPLGPSLVTFETWRITVVGPKPEWQPPVVDLGNRYVDLEWDSYECQNAASMQIWRRVDDTSFSPGECQTGIPESLGFSLIGTVPISETTFTDTNNGKGLDVGAKYCYRLVAVFPLPQGGESLVSEEICIDPILADAPVITNVTVDKTGETDGEITVRWTPPFDIDAGQYPGPYEYIVQRNSSTGFFNVSPKISDTTFMDAGLNTHDEQYFYRVLLFSSIHPNPVDTSSIASSVSLELHPQKSKIELRWGATVPWSNQLQAYPMHRIYRGDEGATENEMVLIDSVNVIVDGFIYLDTGKLAPGDTLNGSKEYCYRVMTRGGYGNPGIREPLINFSQINCAQPTDSIPPCAPIVTAFIRSCKDLAQEYGCDATSFTNTITWSVSPECEDEIRSYNVFAASSENGTYVLLATDVRDTFYIDAGLSSLARCYKVSSIDRSNNESDLSAAQCNDNCWQYVLPNVFSPGNADGKDCNELFSAYGVDLDLGENSHCQLFEPEMVKERCARFVQKVDFTVYNRWGNKVYHYIGQQGDENTIYINWDGRDDKGRDLATAVYFYVAEITVDVVNSKDRTKVLKGWVHLVR